MTILLCSLLLLFPHKGEYTSAMAVCLDVAESAAAEGEDPALLIAIAWVESRLDPGAVSECGAVGPLQAIPRFWGPDPIKGGLRALRHYRRRAESLRGALAMYNAGKRPGPRAFRYADRVIDLANTLRGWAGAY